LMPTITKQLGLLDEDSSERLVLLEHQLRPTQTALGIQVDINK